MKKFLSKFLGFSIGPIIGAVIGFITVPITSNLISPDQFGLASMFNLANTILTLIVLIGIDQAYMREYNEYEDKKKLLYNCILIPFINTIIISLILIIFSDFFAVLLFDNATLTMPVILLAICSPFFLIEKFMLLSIRMEEKALKYSVWNIISKLFNLICLIILLLFYKRNFESVVYATILSQFIISIILLYVCRKNIKISKKYIDKKQIIKILKFGLPLLPATLIGYGLNSMDTIFLRIITDYTELGYYSVALKIVNVLALIQTSFATFWSPMAFKWKAEKVPNERFELVSKGITFAMSIVLIGVLAFRDVVVVILGSEYNKVIYILPFLLFNPIFYTMSETTTLGISFSRKTGYNIIISLISLIVNLILNTALIPIYGAVGAAVATGISYLVFFWVRTIISRKLWYKMPLGHFIFITIILIFVSLCNIIIKNIYAIQFINIISIILIIYNYRELLKYMMNMLCKKRKKYSIGLICFDTQKQQLKNMIQNEKIDVVDLNYEGKNKIKKLFFTLTKILRVNMIYLGYGCYFINPYLKIAKIFHKKVICHWIGTDVLKAKENKDINKVQSYICYNLACSPLIKEELKELNIEAKEIAILPNEMSKKYSALPEKHGVITYLPEGKEDFYGIDYVKYAAQNYPNIQFYVVGNNNDTINLKNVKFLGKITQEEMSSLYDKTTILMRLPKHDGLSLMLLEALIKGKEVLYCYDFPYTRHIENKEQLDIAMKDIISKNPYFNEDGHKYILENYSIDIIKEKLYNTLVSILEE